MANAGVETPSLDHEAAKQDRRKRLQIMDGARKVFLEKGFDAASMNDIARVAGVSKGTLYVYFENKERLFIDLITTEKREELFAVVHLDRGDHDVTNVLAKFARETMQILTRPYYIQAMRTVFSIVNRMPEIGVEFYCGGPQIGIDNLTAYLEAQVQSGVLEIDDCRIAAGQFSELAQTALIRPLLFCTSETPTLAELEIHSERAARLFFKAYRAEPRRAAV